MRLYRPTGLKELQLVRDLGWRAWPPRLPEQPIFYPVTTIEYAIKIARDWNSVSPAPENLGFVTEFQISSAAEQRYPVQDAGGRDHQELWVPSEDLDWFNGEIVEPIQVVAIFQDGAEIPVSRLPDLMGSK